MGVTTSRTNAENNSAAAEHQNDTLPVPNSTLSYWREKPHRLDSHRSTPDLPTSCDVAIIGSGLAGVSVAYHLATSTPNPPSTLLLEARQLCSGATGRNGGHVKVKTATLLSIIARSSSSSSSSSPSSSSSSSSSSAIAAANALDAFVRAQIDALADVVTSREPGLAAECEFELRRSWDAFVQESDAVWLEEEWRRCVERGDEWTRGREFVRGEQVEELTGVKGAKAAVSSPACSLWPYRFVAGLLERAMGRNGGLNVQTGTAVVGVEKVEEGEKGGWLVRTERGTVRARKVVFATNAYTAGLLHEYRGVITPFKGTCAHLATLDGREPAQPRLSHTYNIEYGRQKLETVDYLNPRPDGGIVVGGGKFLYEEQRELWYNTVDDSTLMEPVIKAKYFEGYMQRNFTGWDDSGSKLERIWTGIMGVTPDGFPHVGKVPGKQNQWILAGFNGGGNALVYLCAKGVAKMVLEDVPFEEAGAGIPEIFKTTEERLARHS
ncbi:hypothetical protein DBV05_g5949 [Lasiodiplodia theobromae]|uniref:FAD dependent oxidoreductase domain-containing protein n=1 Tax=Lasiodiplodia theobromae TaxID=45133 RepID=A0A5N5DC54_9PEZI|nr:hypothetical protein DBV05_g5949 [Lasiodiplodia theobromae]